MKILALPVPLRINCECGCDFEYDMDDLQIRTMFANNHEIKWIDVYCPFCKKVHVLKRIDTSYEQNPQN